MCADNKIKESEEHTRPYFAHASTIASNGRVVRTRFENRITSVKPTFRYL